MSSPEAQIEELIGKLHKINCNLKKAPHRRYLKNTIFEKLSNSKSIFDQINEKLSSFEKLIDATHHTFLAKAARLEYSEIQLTLQTKLQYHTKPVSFKSVVYAVIFKNVLARKYIMALFDVKTASNIVQTYDGSSDNLDAFVDAAMLLQDYIADGQVATAVRFLKTRLTGKARLGLAENLNTIEAVVEDVKARCSERVSPENIIAKLKNVKQKTDTNSLCDEIDTLTQKLKSVYVGQGIPEGVAKSMATKAGIDALVNGSSVNYETKLMLNVGTFTSIQEAV